MQPARLYAFDGTTIVAVAKVEPFPNHPKIITHDGRYFTDVAIGYGVDYLTYSEVDPPVSV
jgi:hypothetical protein